MGKIILILILALIPTSMGFWLIRKSKRRFEARMRRIHLRSYHQTITRIPPPRDFEPRSTNHIGDLSCRYNAHSPYIRCAVNPDGPCEDCRHYESSN